MYSYTSFLNSGVYDKTAPSWSFTTNLLKLALVLFKAAVVVVLGVCLDVMPPFTVTFADATVSLPSPDVLISDTVTVPEPTVL